MHQHHIVYCNPGASQARLAPSDGRHYLDMSIVIPANTGWVVGWGSSKSWARFIVWVRLSLISACYNVSTRVPLSAGKPAHEKAYAPMRSMGLGRCPNASTGTAAGAAQRAALAITCCTLAS